MYLNLFSGFLCQIRHKFNSSIYTVHYFVFIFMQPSAVNFPDSAIFALKSVKSIAEKKWRYTFYLCDKKHTPSFELYGLEFEPFQAKRS